MLPTTKERVSVAVAPLLSVTVTRAMPLKPLMNVTSPLVPENGLPATSHAYEIASPSGSEADALNENRVRPAIPNPGAKFIELMTGARLDGVVGVVGVVGTVGVDGELPPPPQAAMITDKVRHTNRNNLRIGRVL